MKAEPQKANQTEPMTTLEVAQERGKRFYAELKRADDTMAAQLLAAWKELIMDELVNSYGSRRIRWFSKFWMRTSRLGKNSNLDRGPNHQ